MTIRKISVSRSYSGGGQFLHLTEDLSDDKKEKKLTKYDPLGNLIHLQRINFDDKGRVLSQEDSFPADNMSTKLKTEYMDDSRKKIDREFYQDGSNSKIISYYNAQNKFLSIEKFEDETSEVPFETTYFDYNGSGHLLEVRIEDQEKNILEKTLMIYDKKSRPAKIEIIKEETHQERTQEYDGKGRVVKSATYQNGNLTEEIESAYNDENCTREDNIRAEGHEIKIKYDKNGRMIYQERIIPHGNHQKEIIKISMEYDEKGFLLSESHLDSVNPQGCFTDRYEYEFFPE